MKKVTRLTRFCNANADLPSGQITATQGERTLQSVQCGKFNVAKTFGFPVEFVFNNADIGDSTILKEFIDITLRRVEGKIGKMRSVGWLSWERKLFSRRIPVPSICRSRTFSYSGRKTCAIFHVPENPPLAPVVELKLRRSEP